MNISKRFNAFRDNYLAAKRSIITGIILLACAVASAQVHDSRAVPRVNSFMNGWKAGYFDSSLHIPRYPSNYNYGGSDTTPFIFVVGNELHYYSQGSYYSVTGGSSIDTTSLSNRINTKLNWADTTNMLLPYLRATDAATLYYPRNTNPNGYLINSNNLSDVVSASAARSNIGAIGGTDTVGKWVNTLYRRSDSVFYKKGLTEYFAFIDSIGGGGGSTTFPASYYPSYQWVYNLGGSGASLAGGSVTGTPNFSGIGQLDVSQFDIFGNDVTYFISHMLQGGSLYVFNVHNPAKHGLYTINSGSPSDALSSPDIWYIYLTDVSASSNTISTGDTLSFYYFPPGAVPSPTLYYQTVQSNTTSQTQRSRLNFSSVFSASDNSGNNSTDLTIANGGVTNAMLANNTISGISLGNSLYQLNFGYGFTTTSPYNGSGTINQAIDTTKLATISYVNLHSGGGSNDITGTYSSDQSFTVSGTASLIAIEVNPTSALSAFKVGITSGGAEIIPSQYISAGSNSNISCNYYFMNGNTTIYVSGITSSTVIRIKQVI
ncbi:MAG: hypothetical protein JST87_05230 [Bacteroidetes bacterium]|nr:hypothetical protein [Bacteroidota bacterium]